MNYADIKQFDVANGPGIRVSLFVSGCSHQCKGCFNHVAWDYDYGTLFTEETIDTILDYLSFPPVAGLTLLGGEPLDPRNQTALLSLVKKVKERFPEKSIWCFTGYDFQKEVLGNMFQNLPVTKELFAYLDVLVDGRFIQELKSPNLRFKGSSNQRTILVQETLMTGELCLWTPKE